MIPSSASTLNRSKKNQKLCLFRYILHPSVVTSNFSQSSSQIPLKLEISDTSNQKIRCPCHYRELQKTFSKNIPPASYFFNEYCLNFPLWQAAPINSCSSEQQQQKDIFMASFSENITGNLNDSSTHHLMAVPKKKCISKAEQKKRQILENPAVQELLKEYRSIKNKNSLINIKEAFKRHINNSEISENLKSEYVNLMGGKLSFSQIKKKINFSLKEKNTNNKCVKFMCKSNQASPIFLHFLRNIDELWLANSKVQNKCSCKENAAFLMKLIQNREFVDLIEHYHIKM